MTAHAGWLLVALPLATALLTLAAGRRGLAPFVAVAGSLLTVVLAAVTLVGAPPPRAGDPFVDALAGPVPGGGYRFGDLALPLATGVGATGALLVLLVAVVVLLVQVYAVWYLGDDARRGPFHATVALFAAAMVLLVVSADLVLTLVAWEVMGWCSYLLVGHWSGRAGPRRAAQKALLVTRVADVGLVLGVTLLVADAGTSARAEVVAHWAAEGDPALRSLALALVVVGVLGKSAQLPFQDWLPDAMEGPTPASALIHAATMVAAGTVLLAQLLPLLALAGPARLLLGVSASMTMVLAALLALLQPDLKRLLAWSTVSQVALMLVPLAVAGEGGGGAGGGVAAGAALLHLYAHAIFKALLFLTLGWLAATRGGTAAARLRGSARQHPAALAGWTLGLLSLAGVPLLVGGVSKEHVVAAVLEAGDGSGAALSGAVASGVAGVVPVIASAAVLATVVLTAAYATRALLVGADGSGRAEVREVAVMPLAVAAVLAVLAALSVVGGWLLVGDALPDAGGTEPALVGGVTLLVLLGALPVLLLARGGGLERLTTGRVGALAGAGLHADALYRAVLTRPVLGLAALVRFLDREVVESYVHLTGASVQGAAAAGERSQRRGRPATGLVLVGVGALVVVGLGVLA